MLEIAIRKQLPEFALDLDLRLPEESVVVLFGPSGAGKSVALSCLAGLLTPDEGRIAVAGRALFDSTLGVSLPPSERRIGLVRQDLALFPHLSVTANVAYGLFRLPRAQALERTRELLALVNLQGLGERKPAELSGGQQQRVALARALAIRPDLLLLDEPFSALDAPTRVLLRAEVKDVQRKVRANMLFVTHDLAEAYLLADYLAVLDRGCLLQFDTPDRVLNQPRTVRVAEVVGVKNILPGVLDAGHIRIGERRLVAPAEGLTHGSRVHVCVRPERITLVRRERGTQDLPNVIEGELIGEESDGANVMLRFRALGLRLTPGRPFDLEIDTPLYVYERLELESERRWTISIKPGVMHVIPDLVSE